MQQTPYQSISLLGSALLIASTLFASAEAPRFHKNDRVTFIGDSITHGGAYHGNAYLFYATRFPDKPFDIYNCGISGDTTPGTNQRFNTDIAVRNPNVATIMLGMNDAWAWCFTDGPPTEAMLKGREKAYETYTREMTQLADSLTKIGSRIIFIKPSIYDETAHLAASPLIGKNTQLARYGEFLGTMAESRKAGIIDFHSYMTHLNARLQQADPSDTIIGKDRVHPGDPGHFVMSYVLLKAQDMPQWVSAIDIDAATGTISRHENCTINTGATITTKEITFTCTENSLPFPVTEAQAPALDWVPFQQELNQQLLKVTHLPEGAYSLAIDSTTVGTYTADQLTDGINLSDNRKTPQYQQALEMKTANDARVSIAGKLRSIAHVRHTMLSKINPPVSENDSETLKAALDAHVEISKGEPWYEYLKIQKQSFLSSYKDEDSLKQQEEEAMRKIWTLNHPKPHRWSLTPVNL